MILADTVNWVTCPKLSWRSRIFLTDFVLRARQLRRDQMRILLYVMHHHAPVTLAVHLGPVRLRLHYTYIHPYLRPTWGLATKRIADGETSMHQGSVIYNTTLFRSTCQCRDSSYTDDLPT